MYYFPDTAPPRAGTRGGGTYGNRNLSGLSVVVYTDWTTRDRQNRRTGDQDTTSSASECVERLEPWSLAVLGGGLMGRALPVRIELWCGSSENNTLEEAEQRYFKADKVARRFDIGTSFGLSFDDGVTYADGYIYPTSANLLKVLDALDRVGVEYDNIDLPARVEKEALYKVLLRRYRRGGVAVNCGEYSLRVRRWSGVPFKGFDVDEY